MRDDQVIKIKLKHEKLPFYGRVAMFGGVAPGGNLIGFSISESSLSVYVIDDIEAYYKDKSDGLAGEIKHLMDPYLESIEIMELKDLVQR